MKVTVIKANESIIYDGKIYSHGMSFEVDEKIGESLMKRGYIEKTAADDSGAEIVQEKPSYEEASYTELKKLAASKGLSASGKKDELIARIKAAEEAEEANEDEEDESESELPNTAMPE